ncbi:MAG: anthranilate phosphoribosyltransferase [Gammaproteobacteria bacterium]|nr:anthranilate phosphoribosyltransferase [Gammaproteobacteria bacterium]
MSLKLSIEKLMHGENLDSELCYAAINELLDPNKNPLQAAAFLVLLRSKSETPQELVAIVNCLRQKMIKVPTQHRVLDIVGTGGDGQNTVNISTGSAILAASCGIKVAKHGNRAASSLAGSADVLEALGVNIQLTPEKVAESIDKIGIGFCYSPNFHPVTKELKLLRKQLNVPTSFNLLGPLLNPANAQHLLLGVMDNNLLSKMATVLQQLYCSRSMLVHGQGLDEISCVGPAQIVELNAA